MLWIIFSLTVQNPGTLVQIGDFFHYNPQTRQKQYILALTHTHLQNSRRSYVKSTRKISSQRGIRAKTPEEKGTFLYSPWKLSSILWRLTALSLWRYFLGSLAGLFPTGFNQWEAPQAINQRAGRSVDSLFPVLSLEVAASLHNCPQPDSPPPWP